MKRKNENGFIYRPIKHLDLDTLLKAKFNNIKRLAKAIGLLFEYNISHYDLGRKIVVWYKRNPQKRFDKR